MDAGLSIQGQSSDTVFELCPTLSGPGYEDDPDSDFGVTVPDISEECVTCEVSYSVFGE